MLIRLIYASTAQDGVDLNEFKRTLLQAQTNNHRRDLTGMLAFNSKIFCKRWKAHAIKSTSSMASLFETRATTASRCSATKKLKSATGQAGRWVLQRPILTTGL